MSMVDKRKFLQHRDRTGKSKRLPLDFSITNLVQPESRRFNDVV